MEQEFQTPETPAIKSKNAERANKIATIKSTIVDLVLADFGHKERSNAELDNLDDASLDILLNRSQRLGEIETSLWHIMGCTENGKMSVQELRDLSEEGFSGLVDRVPKLKRVNGVIKSPENGGISVKGLIDLSEKSFDALVDRVSKINKATGIYDPFDIIGNPEDGKMSVQDLRDLSEEGFSGLVNRVSKIKSNIHDIMGCTKLGKMSVQELRDLSEESFDGLVDRVSKLEKTDKIHYIIGGPEDGRISVQEIMELNNGNFDELQNRAEAIGEINEVIGKPEDGKINIKSLLEMDREKFYRFIHRVSGSDKYKQISVSNDKESEDKFSLFSDYEECEDIFGDLSTNKFSFGVVTSSIKKSLYDLIGKPKDGKITAKELSELDEDNFSRLYSRVNHLRGEFEEAYLIIGLPENGRISVQELSELDEDKYQNRFRKLGFKRINYAAKCGMGEFRLT